MKYIYFIVSLFFLVKSGLAQTNYHKYSTGVSVGRTFIYGDSKKPRAGIGYNAVLDYYLTPYANIGFEFQLGQLKGSYPDVRYGKFSNNYGVVSFNGKMQLGQFLNSSQLDNDLIYYLKGLYVGSGLAAIQSSTSFSWAKDKYVAYEMAVPLSVGININLQRKWQKYSILMLNINYQTMVSFEDGLDAYIDAIDNTKDVYTFFSLGLRFHFGTIGLYQSKRRM